VVGQGKQWVWLSWDEVLLFEASKCENLNVLEHIVNRVAFNTLCLFSAF
jgi:hypothetical protein